MSIIETSSHKRQSREVNQLQSRLDGYQFKDDIENKSQSNHIQERKSSVEERENKNKKLKYLSKLLEKDILRVNDKFFNKLTATPLYNTQRQQHHQLYDNSSTSEAPYQNNNQFSQHSTMLNDIKRQSKMINIIEEASDNLSLGIAIFNQQSELIYMNNTIQSDFLSFSTQKSMSKQELLSYCLDIKNMSSLALKLNSQNKERQSKIDNQLNRSVSMGPSLGTIYANSIINGYGQNSNCFDIEEAMINERFKKSQNEFEDKTQNRIQAKTEISHISHDNFEAIFFQDFDLKNGKQFVINSNKSIFVRGNTLAKIHLSRNKRMIEKLNSGLCTLGELIGIIANHNNYESEYYNKSAQNLQNTDKNTYYSQKRGKSEEDIFQRLEAQLGYDAKKVRSKQQSNQNSQVEGGESWNLLETLLTSTIDYQIKGNQVIITTKNAQKEKILIKVKGFYVKDQVINSPVNNNYNNNQSNGGTSNNNWMDEINCEDQDDSQQLTGNIFVIVEFVKQILFGYNNIDYEESKTEINDYKKRILSSLSHELRTPLNCSIQLLDLLFQSDMLAENQKKMFIIPALNSNQLLLCMINDILDFAMIEKGELKLSFNTFSIINLLRECVSYFMIQAASKDIQIELNFDKQIPHTIHSDEMRVKQVVISLLSNAIKFTSRGIISIYADNLQPTNPEQNSNEIIRISISDTGCGIEQQNLKSIFDGLSYKHEVIYSSSYQQIDGSQKKFSPKKQNMNRKLNTEGAGLGLTIANNIAKGLGGNRKIEVQSQTSKGSTFSFFVVNRSQKSKGCEINNYKFLNKSFSQWKSFQSNSQTNQTKEMSDQASQNIDANTSQLKLDENAAYNRASNHRVSLTISSNNIEDNVKDKNSNKNLDDELFINDSQLTGPVKSPSKNQKKRNTFFSQFASYNSRQQCSGYLETQSQNQSSQHIQEDSCDIRSDFNSSKHIPIPNYPISPSFISNKQQQNQSQNNQSNYKEINVFGVLQPPSSHFDNSPSKGVSVSSTLIRIKDFEVQQLQDNIQMYLKNTKFSTQNIFSSQSRFNINSTDQISPQDSAMQNTIQINTHSHLQKQESVSVSNFNKKFKSSNFQQTITSLKQIGGISSKPQQQQTKVSSQSQNNLNSPTSFSNIHNNANNSNKHIIIEESNDSMSLQPQIKKSIKSLLIEKNQSQACSCNQILIVDDNQFNLHALELKLKIYNFTVDKANSGFRAVSMVEDKYEKSNCCQKYGLIFMDIDMPVKNGYQTTKEIRQYFSSKNTKPSIISACTAYIQESEQIQAKESGMKYYITKPINTEKLEEVLFKVFLQKKQTAQK